MDSLTLALLRIGQATRSVALDDARAVGLTPVQAQTLLFIQRTKPFATTVQQLAATLGSTHASAVGVVDGLVGRGLVQRETSSVDRRVTLLRLTPEGRASCEQLTSWGQELTVALTQLTPEERATLERGLGAVIASLRAAGHLSVAEPCRGCVFFSENAAPAAAEPHHCALLRRHLSEAEAQLDCPEHTAPAEQPA
jgi:DNA-binding MarR family transcriptional regulator